MASKMTHARFPWIAAVLAMAISAGAALPALADETPAPRVRVTTSMGEFVIELYPERAPLTVANFLRYVREGHYNGTLFHRVISNFVVQGGGYSADYQLKPTRDPIPNESGNGLQNKRGTVGFARGDSPHSGNCQFYVNLADNPDLDPLPTRWGYAVFGHVVEGMSVIERIGVVPTGKVGPFKSDAPIQPIVIQRAEVIGEKPAAPITQSPAPTSGAQPGSGASSAASSAAAEPDATSGGTEPAGAASAPPPSPTPN